ncbi:CHAP domain-containing protein [Candidatus Saccharibacteria bacterium]|nr:CHAP domain-containing protein [Candidatus Saccharibacteria bacterium]
MKVIKRLLFLLVACAITFACPTSAMALTKLQQLLFSQNNIIGYDPDPECLTDSGTCSIPSGSSITWIGDSYSVESLDKLKEKFSGVDLGPENSNNSFSPYKYIQYSKHSASPSYTSLTDALGGPSGTTLLDELISTNSLRDYLVFALGTNDQLGSAGTTSLLEGIANKVGDKKVVLVTAYTADHLDYSADNAAKKSFADSHDNFYLADWAAVAKDEYYKTDKSHPSDNGGYDAWLSTIYSAFPSNCGTTADGVTTTTYNGATLAFPIAGATKAMTSTVSTIPCNHTIGCHYGAGVPAGLAAAAFDVCMTGEGASDCNDQAVVAMLSGTITRDIQTTRNGAACNHVRIKSDLDGTVIAYMHLRSEDLGLHAGDHVEAGQLIGHIQAGVHPCNDSSTAHVHIDKSADPSADGGPNINERDPAITKLMNAAYEALPANASGLNSGAVTTTTANTSTHTSSSNNGVSLNLPQETIARLDQEGIKEKAEQNMDIYKHGEEVSGLPWQAFAAIHYREAGMRTGSSLSNGEGLYDHVNVDGIHISGDKYKDVEDTATHLKEMAKAVYGVELSASSSLEDWGNAFLAYNRGVMYKENGKTWEESPYVAAGMDSSHPINMKFLYADSCSPSAGCQNSVAGLTNQNVGALAVMSYLGGSLSSSGISRCTSSSSGSTGSSRNLSDAEAKKLAEYYKTDAATAGYNLPSDMGKWNCVSFSAWFVQVFTSIGKYDPATGWGNGKDTAYYLSQNKNLPTGSEPKPFAVFSVTSGVTDCGGYKCGHTGIVVAVNGDDITTVEAAYPQVGYTEVVHRDKSYFVNAQHGDAFTYLDSVLDMSKLENLIQKGTL